MISFNCEDVRFVLKNKTRIKQWITSVIQSKEKIPGDIAFVFCSDNFLLGINKQFLNHNTLTDIITFDYTADHPKGNICGEIYISTERVKENAEKYAVTFEHELHRIMIHGVLHLLGYADKTKSSKQKMTKQEDLCLKMLETV